MDKITQILFSNKAEALRAGFTEDDLTEKGSVIYATVKSSKKEKKVTKSKDTKPDSPLKPKYNGEI